MFFIGYSKYAPGTVASFITAVIFILFFSFEIDIVILVLGVCLIFIYSVYSIDRFKIAFDIIDAKEIVIDEFVGQSIPILTIYFFFQKDNVSNFILYTLISFILFRFFDIIKPYPINKVDQRMNNGFGVMLDDVIAGFYSSVILLIIFSTISHV